MVPVVLTVVPMGRDKPRCAWIQETAVGFAPWSGNHSGTTETSKTYVVLLITRRPSTHTEWAHRGARHRYLARTDKSR